MATKKKASGDKKAKPVAREREIRSIAYSPDLFDAVGALASAEGRTFAAQSAYLMQIGAAIFGRIAFPETVRVDDLVARLQSKGTK